MDMNKPNRPAVRLYQLALPVWMIIFVPAMWKIILPLSFVLCGAVLMIIYAVTARRRGGPGGLPFADLLRTVFISWAINVVGYLIAAGFLFFWGMGPTLLLGDTNGFGAWWGANVAVPMTENPFTNLFAVLFVLLAIGLSAGISYFLNKNTALRLARVLESVEEVKRAALILALTTAPWWMLLPSVWFW